MTTEQISGRPMTGETVLVTGASSGIGKATALGLAALGAHVAITGRDRDLTAQSEIHRLASDVLQRLPRIDVLVNNVGDRLKQSAPARIVTRVLFAPHSAPRTRPASSDWSYHCCGRS
jgi:NAD(P)-dependent dehydrogenase (short-subunit alcohol dehydrogenase family)